MYDVDHEHILLLLLAGRCRFEKFNFNAVQGRFIVKYLLGSLIGRFVVILALGDFMSDLIIGHSLSVYIETDPDYGYGINTNEHELYGL